MKIMGLVLAAVILVPSAALQAAPRSRRAIESDIATVKRQIHETERKIETLLEADTKKKSELADCDRLDKIYAGYRSRLVKVKDEANAAYREYKELFRLATLNLGDTWHDLWWSFCNTPYLGRLANWKWFGPYEDRFMAARNKFWAARDAFENEKRNVATEIRHNTQLPLGLGQFPDYQAFKRGYLGRKSYCDRVVRPYFENWNSFVDLDRALKRLRTRLAQLEEELAALQPATSSGTTFIKIAEPHAKHLMKQRIKRMGFSAGAGLFVRGVVVDSHGALEAGRLYRGVATVNGRTYTVQARARQDESDDPVILPFHGTLPARPGPFQVHISFPDAPRVRGEPLKGQLLPRDRPDPRRLDNAKKRIDRAMRPAPNKKPEDVQKDLCNAWINLANYQMGQAETAAAMQATKKASAILKRNWPASRKWRYVSQYAWEALSSLEAQDAFEREDVTALERILTERAELCKRVVADRQQAGSRPSAIRFAKQDVREAYQQLAETIVVLTNDLVRARKHWKKARESLGPSQAGAGWDPVWFAP